MSVTTKLMIMVVAALVVTLGLIALERKTKQPKAASYVKAGVALVLVGALISLITVA